MKGTVYLSKESLPIDDFDATSSASESRKKIYTSPNSDNNLRRTPSPSRESLPIDCNYDADDSSTDSEFRNKLYPSSNSGYNMERNSTLTRDSLPIDNKHVSAASSDSGFTNESCPSPIPGYKMERNSTLTRDSLPIDNKHVSAASSDSGFANKSRPSSIPGYNMERNSTLSSNSLLIDNKHVSAASSDSDFTNESRPSSIPEFNSIKYAMRNIFPGTNESRLQEIERILINEEVYCADDMHLIDGNELRNRHKLTEMEIRKIENYIRNNKKKFKEPEELTALRKQEKVGSIRDFCYHRHKSLAEEKVILLNDLSIIEKELDCLKKAEAKRKKGTLLGLLLSESQQNSRDMIEWFGKRFAIKRAEIEEKERQIDEIISLFKCYVNSMLE